MVVTNALVLAAVDFAGMHLVDRRRAVGVLVASVNRTARAVSGFRCADSYEEGSGGNECGKDYFFHVNDIQLYFIE